MGLFKPAWMGKNEEKALRALTKVNDPVLLSEVVRNAPVLSVKRAAISKIEDEEILRKTLYELYEASSFLVSQLIWDIKNSNTKAWATIKYNPPKDNQGGFLNSLLEIDQENLLLDIVDRIPRGLMLHDGKDIAFLLMEKKHMSNFVSELWKHWFQYECKLYEHERNRMSRGASIAGCLSRNFRDLPWAEHCPHGFPDYIIKHGNYKEEVGGEFTIKDETIAALCYLYETLYRYRNDFRADILSLNGCEISSGSIGAADIGGTSDHEMRWYSAPTAGWYLYIDCVREDAVKATIQYGSRR